MKNLLKDFKKLSPFLKNRKKEKKVHLFVFNNLEPYSLFPRAEAEMPAFPRLPQH